MTPTLHYPLLPLEKCLLEQRANILDHWEKEIDVSAKFWMFRDMDYKGLTLDDLFNEILNRFISGILATPQLFQQPVPFVSVQSEIHTLLVGEKVFVKTLREHLAVSEKEWLCIRLKIHRVFREILANKVTSVCESCSKTMHEDLAKMQKLESNLEDFLGRSKRNLDISRASILEN